MQLKTVTIRVQSLDGQWETLGVDRLRGIWPENDSYSADEWGPSVCSFDLRRDPGYQFPDLSGWTPLEVDIGGILVWSGRVVETPDQQAEHVINVKGEGWQYHLDDDQFLWKFVATRLSDFRDFRTFPRANLAVARQAASVAADRGIVTLGWPSGTTLIFAEEAGVMLDLGTACAMRLALNWESSNNDANVVFQVTGWDQPDFATGAEHIITTVMNTGASGGPTPTSFSVAKRYVSIRLQSQTAHTLAADVWFRVTGIRIFSNAAYEGGGGSALRADHIVNESLDRGTLLLSPDRSGVTQGDFLFAAFDPDGRKTPRENIDAANAPHGWRTKVDVYRRMIFAPKPSRPSIEIGAWPGSEFNGAGSSAKEIYNRVNVEGTAPDGSELAIERTAGQQPGVLLDAVSSPTPDNPTFATNAATWTLVSGTTIVRDTSTFDTSPASGLWSRTAGPLSPGDTLSQSFTGTFSARRAYLLNLRLRPSSAVGPVALTLGVAGDSQTTIVNLPFFAFFTGTVGWTPSADRAGATLTITPLVQFGGLYVDSLTLFTGTPTLVDRRGFKRTHTLPVTTEITAELGAKMGDTFLQAHRTTPFKGQVKVTGDRSMREILTGANVAPERLLLMTGDLLRLSHRIDPDNGGHGRDGRIAEVTYTPVTDSAVVDLDNRRTNFEAMLSRFALVVGN